MSSFETPPRNQKRAVPSPPKSRAKAVDLVTGKTKVEYFFDPSQILEDSDTGGFKAPTKTPSKRSISGSTEVTDAAFYSSKHLYVPCTIVKSLLEEDHEESKVKDAGGPALVKTSDGALYKIREVKDLTSLTAPDDYTGVNDVLHLPNISEASLLHTLRIRYKRDDIYTCAGPILISINPYKFITTNGHSLYSHSVMMKYRHKDGFGEEQEPHLFQIADRAYSAMLDSVLDSTQTDDELADGVAEDDPDISSHQPRNQSIIISGESGAGKTEATKFIMQYLARITKRKDASTSEVCRTPDGKIVAALEDRVLSSNPLLETFGNAQTLRNDNSSRFGKFIHIKISTETGAIVGARISNYLLEKTRITQQIDGERNYHIFYQLLAGASPEMLEEFGLEGGATNFKYLGCRDTKMTKKDEENFNETVQCLTRLGLGTEEQKFIFAFTAAVLHLGNVAFIETEDADHPAIVNDETRPHLQKACALLGLKEEEVTEAILTKLLTIGGKTIKKPSTVAMAEDKRDALAKMTYSCIFLWLVESINNTLSHPEQERASNNDKLGFIGVLDIYGFETFEVNGYEQLLINYCNEKLQRHFNRHLFEVEQKLYSTEGVDWTYITFNDNRLCLELIEGGSGKGGILSTLDDSYAGMGSSSEKDVTFVGQLHKLYGSVAGTKQVGSGHQYFVTPKFGSDRQFIIVHYAGEVKYTADGFVEKNMESLSNELKELGDSSTIRLARDVYGQASTDDDASQQASNRRSSIRGFSVASQFKLSLQSLVEDLEKTQPHYIRCIKPNLKKAFNQFSAGEVLKQLRYSGMMEAIRIRREGYALREPHQSFYNRFSVLLSPDDLAEDAGIETLVSALSKRLNVTDADWQIGHSKVFVRRELSEKLERLAKLRVHAAARCVGRFGKWIVHRRLSTFLVHWIRFRLSMLKQYRRMHASSSIQSLYRMHKTRKEFVSIVKKIIKVQSIQRSRLAQQKVRKIRDPYFDKTYRDMKQLLKEEKLNLERAVNAQDFREAAKIESKIENITTVMESRRPMTRKRLEEKIQKMQMTLEEILKRKAYAEAGPVQDELESLIQQRHDHPTVEELMEAVKAAENGVADAAKNRNFARAAAAQAELDAAKQKLQAVLDDEQGSEREGEDESGCEAGIIPTRSIDGIESRSDLEEEISSLVLEMEKAITNRNFKSASELQTKIDQKEKLRAFFPSLEELEAELLKAKLALEDAISRKAFTRADELNQEIDRLEGQLQVEREKATGGSANEGDPLTVSVKSPDGDEKTFDSRFELDQEILETKKLQGDFVVKKQFKRAEALQHFIEKLENLRTKLPTAEELVIAIREKKTGMDRAIAEKRFGDAEKLDQEISQLELKFANEKAKSGPHESDKSPVVASVATGPSTAIQTPPKLNMIASNGFMRSTISSETSVKSAPVTRVVKTAASERSAASVSNGVTPKIAPVSLPAAVLAREESSELNGFPDDVSDVTSTPSVKGRSDKSKPPPSNRKTKVGRLTVHKEETPVSRLRPKKPLVSDASDNILDVCKMLANNRGDAALIVGPSGGLVGIITDTDITRRVIAKHLEAGTTTVEKVMTVEPTCVSISDSAMEAMSIMVENNFRHLPVLDDKQGVVGLLDIAKCLNDAINKLHKKAESNNNSVAGDVLLKAITAQGAAPSQTSALQSLLGPLLQQALGNQASPTLRTLLAEASATIVHPGTSVLDAAMAMAEHRKAALVVENGKLVGIFGFKDMMTRVVAKELPLDFTEVAAVMTPNPEWVSPEITALEALQTMHDNRFLTLPVCEDNGTVVGLLNVMDVINGCGGADGWRSVFSTSLDLEDVSDSESFRSESVKMNSQKLNEQGKNLLNNNEKGRPVSKLRPKKPVVASVNDSVLDISRLLASKRGDAALLVNGEGGLAGILTDTDVTRRVVAKCLKPTTTVASEVMTKNPMCVSLRDSAMDAMSSMVENHFRHLPVIDENGGVVGLLDIAKCLNDAISKIEKSQSKTGNVAGKALMEALQQQGAQSGQAAALQSLLGPLLAQAFGNQTSPTLRSIVAGKPATIVSPGTSILDAGMLMAESRKAALVVENNRLIGIFGFKDMMTRVVAKDLAVGTENVASVMTPNPETVSPDMTVLEALQTMHDNKFLTLPICEENGTVVGLVDVMDVIYGCGGVEGWRSIFRNSLELDDLSDSASVHSFHTNKGGSLARSIPSKPGKTEKGRDIRPVSKLRPKKPMVSSVNDSVLAVAQMLASKRGDAALLVSDEGGLMGIITDTDVTRRVVAKHLNAASTQVSSVMTPNPTCVAMTDSAMDAMSTMVERRFRHLPVVDSNGGVVGLLDIAKCLNDAIAKLEKAPNKANAAGDALVQALNVQGARGAQAAALQALLAPLMEQAFGSQTSPTLRKLLADKPRTIVKPETSILDAGMLMAENRKAALVVSGGQLVGIFGFKDMMTRVVAREIQMDLTSVQAVMTPNPETVSPEMSALEALQIMHDNKFLTLPVCEDNGQVVGLVDVMDIIHGCGGVEGWRSVFSGTLDLEDVSDIASVHSGVGSAAHSAVRSTAQSAAKSTNLSSPSGNDTRSVSMLRPKKPLISSDHESISAVAKMLSSNRGDAAIIVNNAGGLAGIVTDTDFTRRVVAKYIDPEHQSIATVMTPEPKFVSSSDSALDAMMLMIENHFRHLPVSDDTGAVVGVLDIAKCLNDAIDKLEKSNAKKSGAANQIIEEALGQTGEAASALRALLGPMVSQAFGNQAAVSLRRILSGSPSTIVNPESTVLEAALLMTESRKAALVVNEGALVGIFGFKDMMSRVLANDLDVKSTLVSEVMTPNPEAVDPDITVLEALQTMHDHHFLTLPVCESSGDVVGIVDVMDLIRSCGGADGWRAVFDSALDLDDDISAYYSANQSTAKPSASVFRPKSNVGASVVAPRDPVITVSGNSQMVGQSRIPGNIPTTLEFAEENGFDEGGISLNDTFQSDFQMITFKVSDPSGHTHRLRADSKIASLYKAFGEKVRISNVKRLRFKFVDDEGDAIMVTSDDDLHEAIKISRASTQNQKGATPVVKLTAIEIDDSKGIHSTTLAAVGAVVALAGIVAMFALRPKRY